MQRRHYLGVLGTALLAGCGSDTDDAPEDSSGGTVGGDQPTDGGGGGTTTAGGGDQPDVVIVEDSLEAGSTGLVSVVGTARNASDSEISYIEITARLYDADDTRLTESFDNASDVPSGQEFAFEIMTSVEESEVERYEVEASTGL